MHTTLVRPILEYSQTVWDPHTSGGVSKLESVQRRAAWYTLNRYHRTSSVSAMITELNWQITSRQAQGCTTSHVLWDLLPSCCRWHASVSKAPSSTYTYREHAGMLHTIVIQRLSPQLIFPKNSKTVEYSPPRNDPAKHCWILQECRTLHVIPVLGTPLQYILQCRESRPCREEPEDISPLLSGTSAQVVLHSSPAHVQWTDSRFLQDYTITTCAGVFILLKLVQYLSRRNNYFITGCQATAMCTA